MQADGKLFLNTLEIPFSTSGSWIPTITNSSEFSRNTTISQTE